MSTTRKTLRRELRAARRSLTPAQQRAAGLGLQRQLRTFLPLLHARRISFYLPSDGEINVLPLVRFLARHGKRCYLPRLHPDGSNRLLFIRWRDCALQETNHLGIPEPPLWEERVPAWALDVILMPLVGFDRAGNRLGMGGGFYDRTFAFRQQAGCHKPLLAGVAHSIQEVPSLAAANWDIPLDVIATDRELLRIS